MALPAHFSERPYATGSLIGCRAFTMTYNNMRLRGPRFPQPMGAGVNQARCVTPNMSMTILALEMDSLWGQMPEACVKQDCSCGFYAYTHSNGREFESPGRFNAIVEGFGKCVVGPLGFRCSKMRVLALVMPHLRGENDPYSELWEMAGPPLSLAIGKRVAQDYGIPLFDTYAQAFEEFPLSEWESA